MIFMMTLMIITKKERKVVFDDMISHVMSNKKHNKY